jgi:mannose-6-phosphate isomerase-like protein (cupin superfamily)
VSEVKAKAKFQIFRAKDAPGLMETGHMNVEPYTDLQRQWVVKAKEAGLLEGDHLKVLIDIPGFNLTYAWLKKEYPLALHSHDCDCLYYIIAGDVRIGSEILGAGDGFFVPAGVPYRYAPGERGVEVLEFRTVSQFNMVNLSKGEGYWRKAVDSLNVIRDGWATAVPPSKMAIPEE